MREARLSQRSCSAVGLINAAGRDRRVPFAVVCYDNLPHNGRLLAGLAGDLPGWADDRLPRSGDFSVEFRDQTLHLSGGQCCVAPVGAEHRGTSRAGAEVILFQQAP